MRKRILIIDDDLIYRKIIQRILCSQYELILAADQHQALNAIDTGNIPNLIIADINLPGVEGAEFIKILKEKCNFYNIPIMVISGMDDENLKTDLMELGISKYITKPVENKYLRDVIANYI